MEGIARGLSPEVDDAETDTGQSEAQFGPREGVGRVELGVSQNGQLAESVSDAEHERSEENHVLVLDLCPEVKSEESDEEERNSEEESQEVGQSDEESAVQKFDDDSSDGQTP